MKLIVGKGTAVWNIEGVPATESIFLIDIENEESTPLIIPGLLFLKTQNPGINWSRNKLRLTLPDGSEVRVVPSGNRNSGSTNRLKLMSLKELAVLRKTGCCYLNMGRITEKMPYQLEEEDTHEGLQRHICRVG